MKSSNVRPLVFALTKSWGSVYMSNFRFFFFFTFLAMEEMAHSPLSINIIYTF